MAENFPNNAKETDTQIQEAQRIPNKKNPKRLTPRHRVIKMLKVKEGILKAAREKQGILHKGIPITRIADFSGETLQLRRNYLKENTSDHASLSFRFEEDIQSFLDEQKLRKFINAKLAVQEVLKGSSLR